MTDRKVLELQEAAIKEWAKGRGAWDLFEKVDAEWDKVRERHITLFTGRDIGDRVGPGWWAILEEAFTSIEALVKSKPGYQFHVRQIKEKFGGLRFYFQVTRQGEPADHYDEDSPVDEARDELVDSIMNVIGQAEDKASETCEWCGEPGHTGGDGWVKTLCDRHHKLSGRHRD